LTPQQEDDLLKWLFNQRNDGYTLLENYLKENKSRKDSASVGALSTICSKIYSELRVSNDLLQTFGLQALKAERDLNQIRGALVNANTVIVYLLTRADKAIVPQEIRDLAKRLEEIEKQTAEHKPIVDGIKSYLEKAQEEPSRQVEKKGFSFLQ
jgi:hypothetical protein